LFVQVGPKEWKQIPALGGSPIWVLAGGRSAIVGDTVYVAGSTAGVRLPKDCENRVDPPLVNASGTRITCTTCQQESDDGLCWAIRVADLNERGLLIRSYVANL